MAGPDDYGLSYDPSASARPPALTASGQPVRPYADPSQLGGATPRTQEFNTGLTGETDPGRTASVFSLNKDSARFNASVPRQFSQHSVLQTAMPSGIGPSATDQQRMLPGSQPGQSIMLPTQNGSSQDSYQKSSYMRLRGLDVE